MGRCRRVVALILAGIMSMAALAQDEGAPWMRMDYGPFLSTAVGLGEGVAPVPKGLVVRLRRLNGAPTSRYAVFDTDLLAWRCVWSGKLALRGIVFDGPHGTFPRIVGVALFRAPARPGIAVVTAHDAGPVDPREEPWGPIPTRWGRWSGLHLDGDDVVLEYTVDDGRHRVLERVWAEPYGHVTAFVREITIETPGDADRGPTLWNHDQIVRTPANGTIRVMIAPGGLPARPPAAAPTSVHDAIARARPRWGAPIVTRGVVDADLETRDDRPRIVHEAGSVAKAIDLVLTHGQELELLRHGEPVASGPVDGAVILRSRSIPEVCPWTEADQVGWWPSDTGAGRFERNAFTDADDLRLDGVTWRRGVKGRALDFDGTAAAWVDGADLDLDDHDLTVAAWIHTTRDGTIFAVAPPDGEWVPDGVTLFLRGGRLSFDVGWVGVVTGGPRVDDGAWHHVAATWRHDDGDVRLFVDGAPVAGGTLPLEGVDERDAFVARFGWTSHDFPEVSRFSGYMDGPVLLRTAVDADAVPTIAALTGEPLVEGTIVRCVGAGRAPTLRLVEAGTRRVVQLRLPATDAALTCDVRLRRGPRAAVLAWAAGVARTLDPSARPFRIDRLTWPEDNRFGSWLRFGAFDFVSGTDGVVITTWSGDVWRVDGLDEDLDAIRWTRVATGLNQPFGVVVRGEGAEGTTLVLGRDQITRLYDRNGDGEADHYENFTNAARNSEHFHEPASGLLVTPEGDLLYHKAARHAKHALHRHHGTVLRVSADGATTQVVAHGFRAPIGLTRLPDGALLGSDQEGHWTPANRINLIRLSPGAAAPFFGNAWAAPRTNASRIERGGEHVYTPWDSEAAYTPPLCWLPPTVDRSPSSQVYVDHHAWGPLAGSILGLSYGTGEVYLVLRDDVAIDDGGTIAQGGIVKLGIQLPTGLLAGRIHPATGDLYLCGLFGWSSDRTEPGGFYRVRPRAAGWAGTLNVPRRVRAFPDGLEVTFLHPLDPATARDPTRWSATAWNYRRSESYGSKTYDLAGAPDARTTWTVRDARLSRDGRTVRLRIDGFEPAMQVHLSWVIADATGRVLEHEAHLTVHAVHAD